MNATSIPHKVMILYKNNTEREFIAQKSGFNEHPEYFEIIGWGGTEKIPVGDIKGICYEATHLR